EAAPEPVAELPNVSPADEIYTPEAAPAAVEAHLAVVVDQAKLNETQDVPVYRAPEPTWAVPPPVAVAPTPRIVPVAEPEAKQLDMDALIARVLEKMSPEVMHKVTQEILKPVIEALVKEELNSHKS